jgi:UDP-glucose 4-epimerase
MNIILTGHKGLIGDSLKKSFEQKGHKIVQGVDVRDGLNILDIDQISVEEDVDLMVHAAAHCKINQSIREPELSYRNNVLGSYNVLEFCRKKDISKIVFFSSSRVLSAEKNPYTASKLYGEELCKSYQHSYGIDYIIVRPSTVYGPFWDETKRLMHIFVANALQNKDLEIYGDPEIKTLDFTHVKDFTKGVMMAIDHPQQNKEYNISGKEELNIYELAKFIIQETGSKSQIKVFDAEIAQPQQVKVDNSEIEKLGYKPEIGVKEGVRETIEWYKKYMKI